MLNVFSWCDRTPVSEAKYKQKSLFAIYMLSEIDSHSRYLRVSPTSFGVLWAEFNRATASTCILFSRTNAEIQFFCMQTHFLCQASANKLYGHFFKVIWLKSNRHNHLSEEIRSKDMQKLFLCRHLVVLMLNTKRTINKLGLC